MGTQIFDKKGFFGEDGIGVYDIPTAKERLSVQFNMIAWHASPCALFGESDDGPMDLAMAVVTGQISYDEALLKGAEILHAQGLLKADEPITQDYVQALNIAIYAAHKKGLNGDFSGLKKKGQKDLEEFMKSKAFLVLRVDPRKKKKK